MKFKFKSIKDSIFSNETITLEGDYNGPSKVDIVYDENGRVGEGENHLSLVGTNSTHIILMDILDGSKWDTTSKEPVNMKTKNGIEYKQYILDSPSDNYDIRDIDSVRIENGVVILNPSFGKISKEERIEYIKTELDNMDSIHQHTLNPTKKAKAKKDFEYLYKVLNELPKEIDIRDVTLPY